MWSTCWTTWKYSTTYIHNALTLDCDSITGQRSGMYSLVITSLNTRVTAFSAFTAILLVKQHLSHSTRQFHWQLTSFSSSTFVFCLRDVQTKTIIYSKAHNWKYFFFIIDREGSGEDNKEEDVKLS